MLKYLMLAGQKGEDISFEQFQKLAAGVGASGEQFGKSVSISGDGGVVLVGAYLGVNDEDVKSGAAYIFTKQENGSYHHVSKLAANDTAISIYFGFSVSISGDGGVALIGAPFDDDKGFGSGSAYIFTKQTDGTYLQTSKLVANDGAANDNFGYSIYISSDGNIALIGAYGNNGGKGNYSGSAYIFTKQEDGTYIQTGKLVASDGAANDRFGNSVSISGDGNTMLIGAYRDADKGTDSGSAYIFTKQENGTYIQTGKLVASDGAASDFFGNSVSISEDGKVALIGAFYDDDKGSNSGSAYIFTQQSDGTYLQTSKLVASDGAKDDNFGNSVSISEDGKVALIGAFYDDDKGSNSGSAYIFTQQSDGTYLQTSKLVASDGAKDDNFGNSVSISGDGGTVLIGAFRKGSNSGSAYIFK